MLVFTDDGTDVTDIVSAELEVGSEACECECEWDSVMTVVVDRAAGDAGELVIEAEPECPDGDGTAVSPHASAADDTESP